MEIIYVDCKDLWDLKLQDDCCSSCHSEWEDDYNQPLEHYIKKLGVEFQIYVCCAGSDVVNKLSDEDLKKILEFKQKG